MTEKQQTVDVIKSSIKVGTNVGQRTNKMKLLLKVLARWVKMWDRETTQCGCN